eukprot:XP_001702237.1 predicted protein [Chlamydomonas reinhardtii]
MVSRTAVDKALRKKGLVEASELGVLLAFLQDQSDDQMSQWMIRDTDEPEIIAAFVRARAAKDGDTTAHTDQGKGDQLDDNVVQQQLGATRKFTGQVVHDFTDPKTGKACQMPSCVTLIDTKYAATFAHRRTWTEGQDVELEICSGTDPNSMRAVKAKVFHINPELDFALLKLTDDEYVLGVYGFGALSCLVQCLFLTRGDVFLHIQELQAPNIEPGPRDGMKFFGHGLSCPGGTSSNVCRGVITRAHMVGNRYIALDRISGKGDPGGGIFSAATGRLLGVLVGRDTDLDKSYMIQANVLLAATVEETFDPDPPPSGQFW